ncbi:MAG: hypothetical protein J5750_04190 [Clostridiales bacterium]|nr:hypothetical protein [Clostridiales bacterium]
MDTEEQKNHQPNIDIEETPDDHAEEERDPKLQDDMRSENEAWDDELDDSDAGTLLASIVGFFRFLGRTTVQYFRNIPNEIRNKAKAKIAEHRRMPKRKSISKVYVLVGYTTKEYVDQKYRKERILLNIRRILVAAIIILILIMTYRWIMPKIDTNEYKQMVGIEEIDDLTQSDPFATETTKEDIAPESQAVTPIPSNTSETSETTNDNV